MSTRLNELKLIAIATLLVACHSTPRMPDEAVPSAASAQPHDVDKHSQKLFADALGAIEAKRFTDAASLLKELTDRDPSLSSAWFNLGMVQSELGDEDAAETSLKKAVEVNPDNCAAYTEL